MQFLVKAGAAATQRSACVVLGVFEGRKLSTPAQDVDTASKGYIKTALKSAGFEGKSGQTLMLYRVPGVSAEHVLVVGLGESGKLKAASYRKAVGAATKALIAARLKDAFFTLAQLAVGKLDAYWMARHTTEAVADAVYRFDACKSKKDKPAALNKVVIALADGRQSKPAKRGVEHGQAIAEGVSLAKDLGNLPGNICTPSYLAQQARKLGREYQKKLKVTVLEEAEMKKLGMGALLSVSRGSRQPAKLIVMEYKGGPRDQKPYAFVGKGLTFDAGGISLKPAAAMDEMKYDMCGGASVFGLIKAVAEMELPINVVGVVPSSENLPDGDANKPGDIVTSMSGQTIEVLNTDAEGRLILCDALTYTRKFKPQTVVDMATLTGACVIALGAHASGLLTKEDKLAQELLAAGEATTDRAWRLPLWDDYQDQLKSNFADFANIGGREAGTITAGCFLARFTEGLNWAHLDIAGTAWKTGAEKGGTGRPVSLLAQFLLNKL